MPTVTLQFTETNGDEDGHIVYRSTGDIDPADAVGDRLATITGAKSGAGPHSYADTTPLASTTYNYRLSAYKGTWNGSAGTITEEAFSPQSSVSTTASGTYLLKAPATTISVTPLAHFDASAMTGTEGDNTDWVNDHGVGEHRNWMDRIGNFSLRYADGNDQAIFKTNGGANLNSKPAVQFYDGTYAKTLEFCEPAATGTPSAKVCDLLMADGFSIFYVVNAVNAPSAMTNAHLGHGDFTNEYYRLIYNASAGAQQNTVKSYGSVPVTAGTDGSTYPSMGVGYITDGESWKGNYTIHGDDSGAISRFRRNSDTTTGAYVEVTDTGAAADTFGFRLEFVGHATEALCLNGHLAELILFKESLDSTDRTTIENYFTTKYDI